MITACRHKSPNHSPLEEGTSRYEIINCIEFCGSLYIVINKRGRKRIQCVERDLES